MNKRIEGKFMRLLVFFDLPVKAVNERRIYTKFRKFLLNDGYDMIQFSVYCRIVNGEDGVCKHLNRLKNNLPPEGSVRFLQITERQYEKMLFLVGKPTKKEKKVNIDQLTIF